MANSQRANLWVDLNSIPASAAAVGEARRDGGGERRPALA